MKSVEAQSDRENQINSTVSKYRKRDLPSPSKSAILMGVGGAQRTDVNRWKQILSHKAHFTLSRT